MVGRWKWEVRNLEMAVSMDQLPLGERGKMHGRQVSQEPKTPFL